MLRTVLSGIPGMVQPCSEPSMQKRLPLGGGAPTGEQTPAAEEVQMGGPGREQHTRHLGSRGDEEGPRLLKVAHTQDFIV